MQIGGLTVYILPTVFKIVGQHFTNPHLMHS